MEFEFDKEIDFLLRQAAHGEAAFAAENPQSAIRNPQSNHLDADEIAAFVENALPEKARLNRIAHLADCDFCRKNLANLIALNTDAQSEIIHAEKPQLLTEIAPEIPWYRKLFAVPKLVYAMGALVLIFSGIGVYTVLQSNSQNSQVSGVYERQTGGGKGMSSDGDAAIVETFPANTNSSMANMAATNTTANRSSNALSSATNSANFSMPLTAANSNSMAMNREADKDLRLTAKQAETRSEPSDSARMQDSVASPAPAPPPKEVRSDNEATQQLDITPQQNAIVQNQQNQTQMKPDSSSAQRIPLGAPMPEMKRKKLEESKDDAPKKSAETTNVGGKIFRRENNVWYDQTYRGQPTINISRGTNEYKKLDKDLRQIVERIGGTIVVIWKEKAYRIQ